MPYKYPPCEHCELYISKIKARVDAFLRKDPNYLQFHDESREAFPLIQTHLEEQPEHDRKCELRIKRLHKLEIKSFI